MQDGLARTGEGILSVQLQVPDLLCVLQLLSLRAGTKVSQLRKALRGREGGGVQAVKDTAREGGRGKQDSREAATVKIPTEEDPAAREAPLDGRRDKRYAQTKHIYIYRAITGRSAQNQGRRVS